MAKVTVKKSKECNCIAETKEAILKNVNAKEKNPKGYNILEADFEYKSWFPKIRLYATFLIKSTFKKKDGTTSRPRNEHVNVFFSYCPFCGIKLNNKTPNRK